MAKTIIRSGGKEDEPKEAPKKTTRAVKKEEEPAEKKQNVVTPGKKTGGSSVGLRIGAVILWVIAIACEILAIMALLKNFTIRFTHNGNTNMMITLIGFIVLDLIFAIVAAQLWKRANHINPPSKKNKFTFYLISELGVIMACICFIPLIVILLKNDKLDKKSKTIVSVIAIAALLITGFASADYHPISAEEKAEAEQVITGDVYWTTFGHKYHLDLECQAIVNSNTVYAGPVAEAIESGRTAICSFCAKRHEGEYDFDKLKVEDGGSAATEAPETVSVN
ncbi:MAG: hypothetical protein IJS78_06495 [Clostridia bacterium]|nr:hypothetical protein [Clostridia bacterium]